MIEHDLFSYPHRPGFKDQGTSKAAADAMAKAMTNLQVEVIDALKQLGPSTADEVATHLEKSPGAIRPRLSELLRLSKVIKTKDRRKNVSGLSASVWRLP